jgi:hypothetical protein
MSDRVGELLRDKEDFEKEIAALEFKRGNISRTLEEDERIVKAHRQAQLDICVDLAVKRTLLEQVDDELLALAAEAERDTGLESSGEEAQL